MFRSQWGTFLDPLWIVKRTPLRSTTNQNEIFNHNLIWPVINQSGPLRLQKQTKVEKKCTSIYVWNWNQGFVFWMSFPRFHTKSWQYTFPLACKKTVSLSWKVISSWHCSALTTAFRFLGDTICVKTSSALLRASGSDKALPKRMTRLLFVAGWLSIATPNPHFFCEYRLVWSFAI